MTMKDEVTGLLAKLKTERDEIHLKLHLASMDVKQEFDEAEKKLAELKEHGAELLDDSIEASDELKAKVDIIAEELKEAYQRISKRLAE